MNFRPSRESLLCNNKCIITFLWQKAVRDQISLIMCKLETNPLITNQDYFFRCSLIVSPWDGPNVA
jgi:hypothetical protein